jgi:hypothetical protein
VEQSGKRREIIYMSVRTKEIAMRKSQFLSYFKPFTRQKNISSMSVRVDSVNIVPMLSIAAICNAL